MKGGRTVSTILGVIALLAMGATSLAMLKIGLHRETRADGGRYIATAVFALPYLLSVLLAFGVALARGGFVSAWQAAAPPLRSVLVMLLALAAALVVVAGVGMLPGRGEAASAILLRRGVWGSLMAMLLVAAVVAMFPSLTGSRQALMLRAVGALAGIVAIGGAAVLWQQGRAALAEREAARTRDFPGLTVPRDAGPQGTETPPRR